MKKIAQYLVCFTTLTASFQLQASSRFTIRNRRRSIPLDKLIRLGNRSHNRSTIKQ